MERQKKEKLEKQLRLSLKTIGSLKPTLMQTKEQADQSLLSKLYPSIGQLNSLRIFTVLEIVYILEVYLELLEKYNSSLVEEFKIGIIGGGITSKLILNSILPLSKDGLKLSNIIVSTRQTQNFKIYVQNFGVKTHFDNEATVLESDFLIVCTPATLDNWIIKDLKESLEVRIKASQKNSKINSLTPSLAIKIPSEKSKISQGKNEEKNKIEETKPNPEKTFPFRPLVYITTSDFYQEKANKLFPFPVLTPSIRAKDLLSLKQTLEIFKVQGTDNIESHQKILAWWLLKEQCNDKVFNNVEIQSAKQIKPEFSQSHVERYGKTYLYNIIKVLAFVVGETIAGKSAHSSLSNTVSVCQSIKEGKKQESVTQIIEVLTSQGEVDETLFKKIRKWQMAYNNYIS